MLTKKQIMKLARKNKIPAHSQEREYVQVLFLNSLYPTKEFVFKGGTALRLAYGNNRYSEDLDFNSYSQETESVLKQAAEDLNLYGIEYEIKDEEKKQDGYSFRIVYKGPLYVEKDLSKGSIEVEASLRNEKIDKETKLISSTYPEVDNFLLTVMGLRHVFAEKIRALIIRNKPRDLYDIWTLVQRDVDLSKELLNRKLAIYDKRFDIEEFESSVQKVRGDWEQDLDVLLPSPPPFKQVASQVLSRFKDL